ncbi:Tetratricopeptide repeat-containing protein [Desulforamulus putei DSM 12395]|uniref:Tetratricopeptide repeat-containing protein n=1 Tax=Desulforamulus putei DSM 12395 TaxID=1121429 RepID=A0A1M5C319_9FIRM|nr:stalk domain-containing protein [Desulforamulus putei]SHF49173.1 Tetratricopeptide repeat-containing protein [Desulforamulus putei DSM 12395]
MKRKTRLFLSALTLVIFLFGTVGTAFGMGKKDYGRMDNTGTEKELQESSTAEDVYQHKEKRDFEVKTRTRNKGDEFQVKVEERLGREITEGIDDEELTEPGAKGLEKRIAELERKLTEDPGDQKLLWKLAVAYRNTGEYDKAIETLKELEGQLPHPTAKVAVLLAQCLKSKGDKEAALAELEKLLESPTTVSGAVYAYRAILKEELGKAGEASEEMEKAIAAEPGDEDLYKKAGELYKKAGKKGIKVFVKGKKTNFDAEPFVKEGRTMVPVRAIAEALGLDVKYKAGAVVITNPASGKTVTLYLGRTEAKVSGRKVTLDVPAQAIPPGRTVVPLRFVSENLDAKVNWVEDGQVVAVN